MTDSKNGIIIERLNLLYSILFYFIIYNCVVCTIYMYVSVYTRVDNFKGQCVIQNAHTRNEEMKKWNLNEKKIAAVRTPRTPFIEIIESKWTINVHNGANNVFACNKNSTKNTTLTLVFLAAASAQPMNVNGECFCLIN